MLVDLPTIPDFEIFSSSISELVLAVCLLAEMKVSTYSSKKKKEQLSDSTLTFVSFAFPSLDDVTSLLWLRPRNIYASTEYAVSVEDSLETYPFG